MSSKLHSLLTITFAFSFLSQTANGVVPSFYPQDYYKTCSNSFNCGNITGIRYPFRGISDPAYCGHPGFTLECHVQHNITTFDIMDTRYNVLEIDQDNRTLRIIRPDIQERSCPDMANTTLDFTLFDYTASCTNYTFLYGCPDFQHPGISVPSCRSDVYVVGGNWGTGNCETSVLVPVSHYENGAGNQGTMNDSEFNQVLRQGFEIIWKIDSTACNNCEGSNGRCGFSYQTNMTNCFCPDRPFISNTTCLDASYRGTFYNTG